MTDSTDWHGTPDGKRSHQCACEPCRTAWNAYVKQRREARKAIVLPPGDSRHGRNGYVNYACRCFPCRLAEAEYHRARYQAKA